jgi:hypothetical protein
VEAKIDQLSQGHCTPAGYCSETRFTEISKLLPWEATGILFISNTEARLFSNTKAGENLELIFDLENSEIIWVGRKIWRNGFTSWFVIDFDNKKYYFTSETGTFIFGSESTTQRICGEVRKVKQEKS